jgi:hypothetical protein
MRVADNCKCGVGDVDALVRENNVGTLVSLGDFDPYDTAITDIITVESDSDVLREVASKEFDLTNVGGVRYRAIYARMKVNGT